MASVGGPSRGLDIQLSKTLSWLLRHGATKVGLVISSDGYIEIDSILQHKLIRGKFNKSDIERVVATNDKQRFQLRRNPETNVLEIKANQGHTLTQVLDDHLTPILKPQYKTVVHGTYLRFWPKIRSEGLCRMKRLHIHFAKGTLGDSSVISGLRKDTELYIYIDLLKALNDGIKFYESDNGVILTRGNDNGYLIPKYFSKIVNARTGYPDYTQAQDLTHLFLEFGNATVDIMNLEFAVLAFTNSAAAYSAVQASNKISLYGECLTVKYFNENNLKRNKTPKLSFDRSKQKSTTIPPESLSLSGDFPSQLLSLLTTVRLSAETVAELGSLYTDLEETLQTQWPGCKAIPFGSIPTGLGIRSSDADCFVAGAGFRPQPSLVATARRLLLSRPTLFTEILAIPRANTPIVKFFHLPTQTNCDLSFKTPLGAKNSELVAFLINADPRLIPAAVMIKYWGKVHELTGTGRLTNYALTMLVVFYLQQIGILPSVEWLQRDADEDIVDFWNTGFDRKLPPIENNAPVSEIIGGFFKYYSTFDFKEMLVCPYLGTPIKKDVFKDLQTLPEEFSRYKRNVMNHLATPMRFLSCMVVQDPFELCHNVASPVNTYLADKIKAYFKFAADAYDADLPNGCENFLRTILLEKPTFAEKKPNPEYRVKLFTKMLDTIADPDWRSVVREIAFTAFERILKMKLEKVEFVQKEENRPPQPSQEAKRVRERYSTAVTKPVWNRKRFNRINEQNSKLDFVEKHSRITEEIIRTVSETFNIEMQVIITFNISKTASLSIRYLDGDLNRYREFGRFYLSVMQNWLKELLKPYAKSPASVPSGKRKDEVKIVENYDDSLDSEEEPTADGSETEQ